jgi:hypothetical protein
LLIANITTKWPSSGSAMRIASSGLEWGNYSTATFDLHVVSGATITGASFVGYTKYFS